MTKRESKRCCARFYIYFILLASNILWALCLTSAAEEIVQKLEVGYGIWILFCFYVDIRYVKCKNLKYACKSYDEDPVFDGHTQAEITNDPAIMAKQ